MKWLQSCLTVCNPMDWSLSARLLSSWDSPGKNAGMGFNVLLQGILPTQGQNPCLRHHFTMAEGFFTTIATWEAPTKKNCIVVKHTVIYLDKDSSVHSLSHVQLFATPWIAECQASLSITNSRSPPKPMSIESVMPSNHLILCHRLLHLPSIFPSIKVFSDESALRIRWPKYWSFRFCISLSNEHPGLISFRMDLLDLLAVQGTLKSLLQHHSSKASTLWCSAFFMVQLSHPYMTTRKTIAFLQLTTQISDSFWLWVFSVLVIVQRAEFEVFNCVLSVWRDPVYALKKMGALECIFLSFTISWSLLKLMSTESVMLSKHLIFCCPLLSPTGKVPRWRVNMLSFGV